MIKIKKGNVTHEVNESDVDMFLKSGFEIVEEEQKPVVESAPVKTKFRFWKK